MDTPERIKCTVYWISIPEHTDMFSQGYIGITTRDVRVRFSEHKATAKSGRAILSKAIGKYKDKINIQVILVSSEDYCKDIEKKLRPTERIGWNTVSGGGKPPLFREHSEESKKKIGVASKGNKHNIGRVLSEETKAKISKSSSLRKYPDRVRKPHSEETKAKMSASKTARDLVDKLNRIENSSPEI